MRERQRILANLETAYREAFEAARERDDRGAMARLDLDFQRDQLQFELLLDLRDLLAAAPASSVDPESEGGTVSTLLDHAQALRKLTRLR